MNKPIFVKFKSALVKSGCSYFQNGQDVWIDITKVIMIYERKLKEDEEALTYFSFIDDNDMYIDEPIEDVLCKIENALLLNNLSL